MAKAQAQAVQAGLPLPAGVGATQVAANTSASLPPSSSAPTPQAGIRRPQTPASMGAGTPRPQGPGPGPPARMGSGTGTPTIARPGSADAQAKRGKKRELEDEVAGGRRAVNGLGMPGTPGTGISMKPGAGMPRPTKKPRTVRSY